MKNHLNYVMYFIFLFTVGCSSSELVDHWKNPDIDIFEAQKVLVVGISPTIENRRIFENQLATALRKKGITVVKSLNLFKKFYTQSPKTENELLTLEKQLVEEGFDAILLSKVVGEEEKVSVVQAFKNMKKEFGSFKEDYFKNQGIYFEEDYYNHYKIYHAETALYCICPDKERELIWRGAIDVTEPENIKNAISDYVKVLIWALKEQNLLILEKQ